MNKYFNPKKVKNVEKFLQEQESCQWELEDHIYRSYHSSFKIDSARFHALQYLYLSLYLLDCFNKIDWTNWSWDKMIKTCKKHIMFSPKTKNGINNLTCDIFNEMISNNLSKSKGWVPIREHIIPYLGYFIFFKGILKCLIKYAKQTTGKESYHRRIETWEGVAEYFIGDINHKLEILKS